MRILHPFDSLRDIGCAFTTLVEESIDNILIEPRNRSADKTEYYLLGDKNPHLIDIETVVGCSVQSSVAYSQSIGNRLLLARIDEGCQRNGTKCHHQRYSNRRGVDMNMVCLAIATYKLAEGDKARETGDECQNQQWQSHGQRRLLGGVSRMQLLVLLPQNMQ